MIIPYSSRTSSHHAIRPTRRGLIPWRQRTGVLGSKRSNRFCSSLVFVPLAVFFISVAQSGSVTTLSGGRPVPPVDRDASFTAKVLSLIAVLTLDEKISLVHGATDPASLGQAGYLPGVPRLGIPPRRDADALGINVTADATALPARLGLGATFDPTSARLAGELEGREGRALGVDLIYGPQIDLTRQPNWGRNNTTYGEDPFLNGQLAIQEVTGVQSMGLMDEVKHFTIYNGQAGAGFGTAGPPTLPTIVDDQIAHELYLKQFEYAITESLPSSVMDSYQGFQIVPLQQSPAWASDNPLTLMTILRGQWDPGFRAVRLWCDAWCSRAAFRSGHGIRNNLFCDPA
jgi:beta-glucosidase